MSYKDSFIENLQRKAIENEKKDELQFGRPIDYEREANTKAEENFAEKYIKDDYGESLENVDWQLAYHIYNFLTGKTNKLPLYDFVDEKIENKEETTNSISIGYGLTIDKDLKITNFSMITPKKERIDVITDKSYYAYTPNSFNIKEIDIEKFPIYDIKRIKYLQEYIGKYHEYQAQQGIRR